MTLLDRVREVAAGKPSRPTMPIEITADELTPADPAVVRGTAFYIHRRWGVLKERPDYAREGEEFGNLPFVEVDDPLAKERRYRVFSFVDDATWVRLNTPRLQRTVAAEPIQPASALRGLSAFRPMTELIISGEKREVDPLSVDAVERAVTNRMVESAFVPGQKRAETIEEMVARFSRKKIENTLAPDGRVVTRSPRGRLGDPEREALRRVAPLLRAYLAGKPLPCAWCKRPATILLEPEFVEACEEHGS